ncbi:MAG: NAD(+) synthase [Muribaculaceae bacterium]|nr:NAD(+) synthase [Muribaculaceae bacterium]
MQHGFFRVASAAPKVTVGNTAANTSNIVSLIGRAHAAGADAVVFPELSITGYTCGELFHNATLLKGAVDGVKEIVLATLSTPDILVVVGAPIVVGHALYNCAVIILNGKVEAVVPKTYIPNYNEFYEKRWFTAAPKNGSGELIELYPGVEVPFVAGGVYNFGGVEIGVEVCEDLWTPIPPSSHMAMNGAEVIFNLSASDDLVGKYSYLANLLRQQSARCFCAYVYASAGFGESSTDLVFDAKLVIADNGNIVGINKRWQGENQLVMGDVDILAIRRDRVHNTSFNDCARREAKELYKKTLPCTLRPVDNWQLLRNIDAHPFVPATDENLKERCEEIIGIQVAGLAQRLDATGCKRLVIGISGGLDSTLALLVATRTFDRLGLDRKGILGVTMPGFGTTDRTRNNAIVLMETLGVDMREISIVAAVNQHFEDIGHDASVHDVTYENCQARERTQLLMDIANQTGAMVLGTGDLSELALGWATYNGDHMSMYGVNAGVPKTLVKHLVRYFATITDNEAERVALLDIVDTPISPELIPAEADGTISQKTEDLVGPYELHDFFIYYTLRCGSTPRRILVLAEKAFEGVYDRATILKWEKVFFRRFFSQQFKRSCMPDGPKIGSVCLSPRGDWRMPSDASSALWLKELEELS